MENNFAFFLKKVLYILRALKFCAWNTHWNVQGDPYYGDHLLFQRIYQGKVDDWIDTLAEKMVYLGISTNDEQVFEQVYVAHIRRYFDEATNSQRSIQVMYDIVLKTMIALASAYKEGTKTKNMSLGMDDYLMATSNELETFAYLIKQRLK
jgi:DNA-binding ferritin-like protein